MINSRTDLGVLFISRNKPNVMIEFLLHEFNFALERVIMLRFVRGKQMTMACESASYFFFLHDLFNGIDRIKRALKYLSCNFLPIFLGDSLHSPLEACQHHTAVTRTRAPAYCVRFEHRGFDSVLC